MWGIAAILLGGVSALLLWRLMARGRVLRDIAAAIDARRVYIPKKTGRFPIDGSVNHLVRAANNLVAASVRATREQKEFLGRIETTLGALREGVAIVDPNNRVLMANDVMRQFVGNEMPVLGHRLERLMPSAEFLAYVNAVQSGETLSHEEIEVRRGARSTWFEVVGARLPEEEANPDRLTLFVLHDITERKRLETIRTEFVANVSHELRTPVTVIKGFCETLFEDRETLSPEERARFLGKIHRNVERLDALLADLLTLARLESSREPLALERIALGDLVTEVCEYFRDRLEPDQKLTLEREPGETRVRVDPVRISQALENLLENARRHARGMRNLRLRVRCEEQRVICTVQDDGCGIPEADLERIFERFYRVDKSRSRARGGTGLGLAIVKHIVQQHGGHVRAESELGHGSRFHIILPTAGY